MLASKQTSKAVVVQLSYVSALVLCYLTIVMSQRAKHAFEWCAASDFCLSSSTRLTDFICKASSNAPSKHTTCTSQKKQNPCDLHGQLLEREAHSHVDALAVHAGSYLLCSASQSAYPKNYRHEDGGVYNGQWQGRNKQGLGVYRYPQGARYEGEWRNNSKEGRGVYTFPKVNFPTALSTV